VWDNFFSKGESEEAPLQSIVLDVITAMEL
jgi:hypothetical protein